MLLDPVRRAAWADARFALAAISYASRTRRAQELLLGRYRAHCGERGVEAWPVTEDALCGWLLQHWDGSTPRSGRYFATLKGTLRAAAELRPERWALSPEAEARTGKYIRALQKTTPLLVAEQAGVLTVEALEALAAQAAGAGSGTRDEQLWVMVRLLAALGCRSGDLVRLRAGDVSHHGAGDSAYYEVRLLREKTMRGRKVLVFATGDALEHLCAYRALQGWLPGRVAGGGPEAYLFPAWAGEARAAPRLGHMSQRDFAESLRDMATAAGVAEADKLTGHAGRRGKAVLLLAAGLEAEEVARLVGWKDVAMVHHYATPRGAAAVAAARSAAQRAELVMDPSVQGSRDSQAGAVPGREARPPRARRQAAPRDAGPAPGGKDSVAEPPAGVQVDRASTGPRSSRGPGPAAVTDAATADTLEARLEAARAQAQERWRVEAAVPEDWDNGLYIPVPDPTRPRYKRRARAVAEAEALVRRLLAQVRRQGRHSRAQLRRAVAP